MVQAVRVTIFSQRHVFVAVHDLYLPVIAIQAQNSFRCGRFQARYQVGDLCFAFCDGACPDMLAIAGDAGDGVDRGPCLASIFAECVGR